MQWTRWTDFGYQLCHGVIVRPIRDRTGLVVQLIVRPERPPHSLGQPANVRINRADWTRRPMITGIRHKGELVTG